MLILNFDSTCVCENNKLSKEGIMSFREMAYPVGTSEEVVTRGINQFLSYIYNNENLRCVCSSDDVANRSFLYS